jgi:hypothetical protein
LRMRLRPVNEYGILSPRSDSQVGGVSARPTFLLSECSP